MEEFSMRVKTLLYIYGLGKTPRTPPPFPLQNYIKIKILVILFESMQEIV